MSSTNAPKFFAATHKIIPNEQLSSYFKHYLSFNVLKFEDMVRRDIYCSKQPSTPEDPLVNRTKDLDCFEALEKEFQSPLKTNKYSFLGSHLPQDRIYAQELLVAFSYLPFGTLLEDIPQKNFLLALDVIPRILD